MYKKAAVILGFLVSPFVSLIMFTPGTTFLAIPLAYFLTRSQCANEQGESLCGFDLSVLFIFIFNAIFGFCLAVLIHLWVHSTWKKKNKILISIVLFVYFSIVTLVWLYFSMIKPGYVN